MSFNSIVFLAFFAVFYSLYLVVRERTWMRLGLTLAGSAVFYGWWDWRFLFLIAFTGSVDFFMGLAMSRCGSRSPWRKACVTVSLLCGIGSLSVFKYSAFFAAQIAALLRIAGIEVDLVSRIPQFCLILPVGISFYTFQSLSYTIDVYRGQLKPTGNPVHYFAYLMLFPQLVAGPIVRASDLLWQIRKSPSISPDRCWGGLKLCVFGFFKKCVIADNLAFYVDTAFANVFMESHTSFWWVAMAGFAVQIYCDFSGYSDIARGLIEMMGYRFGINFNHPFSAVSVKDFWRRWHISLSSWFRDYVYFPLGGGRGSTCSAVRNIWITFLLSGLWHGAGWNFVIWGGVHAFWLTVERITSYPDRLAKVGWWGRVLCLVVAQVQILVAWVFFRADNVSEAFHVIGRMFAFHDFRHGKVAVLAILAVFAVFELWFATSLGERVKRRIANWRMVEPLLLGVLAAAAVFLRGDGNAFIYFQF